MRNSAGLAANWLALVLLACASPQTETAPPPSAAPPPPAVAPPPSPPVAKKEPTSRALHGDTFVDDYFWLKEKGTPDVMSYLKSEADYADAMMKPLSDLQGQLYQKIVSHIAEDDETVPAKKGAWLYWSRVQKGKSYPVHLRKKVEGGEEQVLLDVNALAEGKAFLRIGSFEVSDDGNWLAYSTDETGFRQYVLQFKDLNTGKLSPETIKPVVTAAFAADNKTVFYVIEDAAKRPYKLLRHTIGDDPAKDVVVLEEKDGRFEQYVWRTLSGAYLVTDAESSLANELRLIDAKKPTSKPVLIKAREGEIKYYAEDRKDQLYIRVNDKGRNFRIVTAPVKNPGPRSWKQFRAHDPKVMIEDVNVFSGFMVTRLLENGLPYLELHNFKARTAGKIKVPEQDYAQWTTRDQNREFDATKLRYSYESLATPETLYEIDVATNAVVQLKQDPVPGGFDRANYATERVAAKAKDGAEIPISIVYRNGAARDGSAPLLLIGYGAYGYSFESTFAPERLALLDRGVVLAIAHIRGGGEMGKVWHEQGRLANKMNTFTDFIACAEHLIEQKYTSKERLAIWGKSAGGLLIGAVTNLRPELFKAVIADVPFVDVINTMNDPTLPLTIIEYEEWGNPTIKAQYDWIKPYSPYDNIEGKAYPSMLVKTSINDSQVMYWEPAKYVARLRALKTDQNPLIFKIHLDEAGHGGKSGRYEKYRETAYDYSFILWQLGLVNL
jgi:oligopeptidase B